MSEELDALLSASSPPPPRMFDIPETPPEMGCSSPDYATSFEMNAAMALMAKVLQDQHEMQETLTAILAKFDTIAGDIRPLVDTVTNHPMMKMLVRKNT